MTGVDQEDVTIVRALLISGLLVQVITCINQLGYFHPDAHFQIVEFAGTILRDDHTYHLPWEHESRIRPTLAVYLYAGLHRICEAVGIADHFTIHMVSRLLVGVVSWYLMSLLVIKATKPLSRVALFIGLASLQFLWYMPFIRSMMSSEQLSAIFLVGALLIGGIYDARLATAEKSAWRYVASGALMSCAFYSRFQIAFALVGVGIWLLIKHKQRWKIVALLALGFTLASLFFTGLDSMYYQDAVCTPYRYFVVNIVDGVASSFGTSPWYYYTIEFIILFGLPVASIFYFSGWMMSLQKYWSSVFFLLFLFFLLGHSVVGHKEERFLFPVLWCIPIFLAQISSWYSSSAWYKRRVIRRGIIAIAIIGGVLNTVLIVAGMLITYAQPLHFTRYFNSYVSEIYEESGEPVEVAYLYQSPHTTPSMLPIVYYSQDLDDKVELIRITDITQVDSISADVLVGSYKHVIRKSAVDPGPPWVLIYEGNPLLARINRVLMRRGWGRIDDLWLLYGRE